MKFETKHLANRFVDRSLAAGDPALTAVETRLDEAGSSVPIPPGLVERVFNASVSDLPQPVLVTYSLAAGRGRWISHSSWSRLALAACCALAFIVARPLIQAPTAQPLSSNEIVALLAPMNDGSIEMASLAAIDGARDGHGSYMETLGIFGLNAGDLLDEISRIENRTANDG